MLASFYLDCIKYHMKKIITIGTIFCCLLTTAYAQNKSNIKSIAAYFTVSIPGMQRVDENGNKINPIPFINRFLYVEVKGKAKPIFDTIYYNSSLYTYSIIVESNTNNIGINKKYGMPIIIKATKGNTIWRIDLQPLNDKQKTVQANASSIIVKGKIEKIPFKVLLKYEIELSTPDMY